MQDICTININLKHYYQVFNFDLVKYMVKNKCQLVGIYISEYSGSWFDWFTLQEVNFISE